MKRQREVLKLWLSRLRRARSGQEGHNVGGGLTKVTVSGRQVCTDIRPAYPSRIFEGYMIRGWLFDLRAVQGTFDDANPETHNYCAYPDTGVWDPERSLEEFCAALRSWKKHRVLGFTVNLQGGGPLYAPEIYYNYGSNGVTLKGELMPAYAARLALVFKRADKFRMVAIVGFFYWICLLRMQVEAAFGRGANETATFLESASRGSILVEIANEIDVVVRHMPCEIIKPQRQPGLI